MSDGQLDSSPAIATISIALVDDNQPLFMPTSYLFAITEGISIDTALGFVVAMDADVGDEFLYQLSTTDSPFNIDSVSGEIRVGGALDREATDEYTLTVILTRTESPFSSFNDEATVVVTILDENDQTPVFNASVYIFDIPENLDMATPVGVVHATDGDIGNNSQLLYSINQATPFIVNPQSGVISPNLILDRDEISSYQFTVTVQDSGQPMLSATAIVMVILSDINDNHPLFSQSVYSAVIIDNAPTGASLFQLSATDRDEGSNGHVTFGLLPLSSFFSLNSSTGTIVTAGNLAPGLYNFTAVAVDSGAPLLSSTASVSIQVLSFDSTLPQFSQSLYEGEVVENSPEGVSILTILAEDPLTGGSLMYSIPSTPSTPPFALHPLTGQLTTSGNPTLDRELQNVYQFQVTATAADGERVGVALVIVRVRDANDFPPLFVLPSYTFSVPENSLGTSVGNVLARDLRDIGDNALIVSYTSSDEAFAISTDGEITVAELLDRETTEMYVLIITAIDGGTPALSGSASVTVNVLDRNDNPPVFTMDVFEGSVQERQQIGTPVLIVMAIDSDIESNAVVSYSTNHTLFSVHPQTGELSTMAELDFETLGSIIGVTIFAMDRGEPSLSAMALALITILDVDDSPPMFSRPEYIVAVLEEQLFSALLQFNATDIDSGPNNPLIYAVVEGTAQFRISSTGLLSVVQSLDREVVTQHVLIISATSQDFTGASLSATARVIVQVLDVNDHPPQFTGLPYQFTISEGAPDNAILGTLTATDNDIGPNANVSGFVIINEEDSAGIFDLDPQSGLLRLSLANELDRETMDSYLLQVGVADGDTSTSLFSITNVSITITDVNDNPPMFELPEYTTSVRESANTGLVFFTALATDNDQGSNAMVSYSLVPPSPFFSVNATTGGVLLASTVDFESQQFHTLTIVATDMGTPPLSGSTSLLVNIIDADDLPVVFTPDSFSGGVFENSNTGTPILTVTAQDPDTIQSNPITYSLEENVPFSIDAQSGLISVASAIDRETIDMHTFQVFAGNLPGISATATVTVVVLDVNDIVPVFANEIFEFQALESATVGIEIGQVNATDGDIGSAGEVVAYGIQGGSGEFAIDPQTGVITLAQSLDFELMQVHIVTVTARDGGTSSLTGSAEVRISVLDINDNTPQFSMATYTTVIAETEPIGAFVFTAQAADADSGINQRITYSLGNPSRSQFSIDPQTGDINTTAPLALQNYTLTMIATDNGTPPLSNSAVLVIQVTDTNERPQFSQPLYSVLLVENMAVGSIVLQVSAIDSDVGGNAAIMYAIQTQGVFVIENISGNLILNEMLDFEEVQSYERIVIATDSGTPPLSATATVLFTIEDVNDNSPEFSQSDYIAIISEGLPAGSEVIRVSATDRDSSDNAVVVYSLREDSPLFTINPVSGAISTLQELDFELSQSFALSVMAQDRGEPPLNSTVGVAVLVTDVDDNPPIFDQQLYQISVSENATIGSVLLSVNASDRDGNENAAILYSLSGQVPVPFQLDSNTGDITVMDPGLDRESIDSYTLTVIASNPFSTVFTATTIVQIIVLDSNDVVPSFDSELFQFTISEAMETGFSIGTIAARDNDVGTNAQVSYSLLPSSDFVSVVVETGELQVSGELDFEATPLIELTLIATDAGTPPLTSAVTVQVILTDVNDVQPLVTFTQSQFQYIEESAPINIAGSISVIDPDTSSLQNAVVMLTLGSNGVPPPSDFIQLDRGFSESQGLVLTASANLINITGPATPQVYTSVMSRLQFGSTAGEPLNGLRQISLQVFDGVFTSNVGVISVSVVTINDNPPVLDLSVAMDGVGYQTTFVEGGSFVFLVAGDAMLTDLDGDVIEAVLVNLTNPLDGTQEVISSISFGSVTVEATGHILSLIGPASISEFELILQTVTYENRAGEPSDTQTPRLVEFTVTDGNLTSNPAVTSVRIQLVNDPPSLFLGGTVRDVTLTYFETDANLLLFPMNFVLSDSDSEQISFVNITIINFQPIVDRFLFSAEGSNLTIEVLSGTLLVSGPAAIEDFEDFLTSVAYLNTLVDSEEMDQLQGGKVVLYSVSDGFRTSAVAMAFITFSAVNDPPFIDLNGPEEGTDFFAVLTEGDTSIPIVSNQATLTDSDSDTLIFVSAHLQAALDGGQELLSVSSSSNINALFNTSTNQLILTGPATVEEFQVILPTLVYQHLGPEPTPGIRVVTIVTSDGEALSLPAVSRINVQSINDPPLILFDLTNTPFTEGGPPVALFTSASVSDPDNQLLAFATVTIDNVQDSLQEVISSQVGGVNVTTSQAGGRLSFTFILSSPTVENFEFFLAGLFYNNLASEPTPGGRNITLVLSDGEDLSAPVIITLVVEAINDNSPMLQNPPAQVNVLENAIVGTDVYQPTVIDEDADSEITYSLLDASSMFNISASSGLVTLGRGLDRETRSSYLLTLTASDGLNTVELSFLVVVLDVNDVSPVFQQPLYTESVDENTLPNTLVTIVTASDEDAGTNAQLWYAISAGNLENVFAIDSSNGSVSVVGSLDFERVESYSLMVIAQDMGEPARTGTAFVVVSVTDVNDNLPVFNPNSVSIEWTEDTPINTVIYTAMATDNDANAELAYSLISGDEILFRIESLSGNVILISPLDFEENSSHNLELQVYDGQFTDLLQLNITVGDVNDNRPIFELNSFSVSISENASIGVNILAGLLVVRDEDEGSNAAVQFVIESGDPLNQFAINIVNVNTAQLVLIGRLDRETRDSYLVTIVARNPNNRLQNDTAIVNIQVEDVNDFSPVFNSSQYVFSINEHVSLGSTVGTVFAVDQDIDSNGYVTYAIVSGDLDGDFNISTTGQIRVSGVLDREMTSQYTLEVSAQDRGSPSLSTTTIVDISVGDINDHRPQFIMDVIQVTLPENSSGGTSLTTLQATDSDEGINAQIQYSVHPANTSQFFIDQNGTLFTLETFDYETDPSILEVIVLATDGGSPFLVTEARVIIYLLNVNEFPPVFEEAVYSVSVLESVATMTTITTVSATDMDGGDAGEIEYIILLHNVPFTIDNVTG